MIITIREPWSLVLKSTSESEHCGFESWLSLTTKVHSCDSCVLVICSHWLRCLPTNKDLDDLAASSINFMKRHFFRISNHLYISWAIKCYQMQVKVDNLTMEHVCGLINVDPILQKTVNKDTILKLALPNLNSQKVT